MTYKIEKGIPTPKSGRALKYPWPDMGLGDSFFVATSKETIGRSLGVSGNGWCRRNAPERRVTVQKVDGGYRVWMVAK